MSYVLSFKFTIYALLVQTVKDVIVNIIFGVFNMLLTLNYFGLKFKYLIMCNIASQRFYVKFFFSQDSGNLQTSQ
jgi:hypothetical protein